MATEKTEQSKKNKDDRIYVRLNRQLKREFEILAEFKGLNTSAMLHSFVVRSVYEEKRSNPALFDDETVEGTSSEAANQISLSEKLVASESGKPEKNKNAFITSDGKTIPLVDEGVDEN